MCFQKWSIFRLCPQQILRLFFGKLNGIWMGFTVVVWLMVLGRHNWLWSSSYQSGAKKSLLGSTDTLSTVLPTITTSEQEKVLFIYIKKNFVLFCNFLIFSNFCDFRNFLVFGKIRRKRSSKFVAKQYYRSHFNITIFPLFFFCN